MAEGTRGVNKNASEMRCTATRALDRDLKFFECAVRKGFEAGIEWSTRNGRRFRLLRSVSSSAFMAANLDSRVRSKKLWAFRLCHSLHARRAITLCYDLDWFEAAQVSAFFLLLLLNV